jgi:hypothetical protein
MYFALISFCLANVLQFFFSLFSLKKKERKRMIFSGGFLETPRKKIKG